MSIFQSELDQAHIELDQNIDTSLAQQFKETQFRLSVVETISWGSLTNRIRQIEGASDFFVGSATCISPLSVAYLCGVKPLLKAPQASAWATHSAQLATAFQARCRSQVCLSVSAMTSPKLIAGIAKLPVGVSILIQEKMISKVLVLSGTLPTIDKNLSQAVLMLLKQALLNASSNSPVFSAPKSNQTK